MIQPPTSHRDAKAAATQLLEAVGAVVAELHPHGGATVTLDSALDRDLGLDSLGRVELLARLEAAFDVTIPEAALSEAESPRDLLRAVLGAEARRMPAAAAAVAAVTVGAARPAPAGAETLLDVLDWHVATHAERPHIRLYDDHTDGAVITYGELAEGAGRVAAGLQGHGVGAGQAVVIMLPTGREYFFAFFGVLMAGAVPVPIYPPGRISQIEEHLRRHGAIIANCRAPMMVTVPEATRFGRMLAVHAETLRAVVTVAELSTAPGALVRPGLGGADTAFLQYTSGSTGAPKGVVLSHANLLANIRAMGEAIEIRSDDVFVSWLPLYHDMGLIGAWLGTLYHAIPVVIMSPLQFLARPQRWLWAVHRFRGSLSAAPNFAYDLCLRRIDEGDIEGLDLGTWRAAFNGAEAVSAETARRFCERFAPWGFDASAMTPVYGLAESSVGLAFPPTGSGLVVDAVERDALALGGRAVPAAPDDAGRLEVVDCGRPLPGHEIRVVDGAGRELPERHQGRLQFRGPSATAGYFRNPQASAELFHGEWLDSGDFAYIAGGSVHVTGRAKDIVIRAGRNIYPAELEDAVGALDGVRRGAVAVFGSADSATGTERLVVLAETRRQGEAARRRIVDAVNALAQDLIGAPPDDVVLAPPNTVLKTSSGKIRRRATRRLHERGLVGRPRRAVWWQTARLAAATAGPRLKRAGRDVAAMLYAAYAWALLVVIAPPTWLALAAVPHRGACWALLRLAMRTVVAASGTRLEVHGDDAVAAPGRACIYVCNHASYLDVIFVSLALPGDLAYVAKGELAGSVVPRLPLERLGTEFVERFDTGRSVADARRVADAARAGRALVFFAEGTFSRMPGLLPFHMGAFVCAAETGVPVIPVTLRGTRSVLRDKSLFPRRGSVSVTIDAAIEAPAGSDTWSAAVALRDAVRARILARCGEPDLGRERVRVAPE